MSKRDTDEEMLDELFQTARHRAEPSADFLARLMADADEAAEGYQQKTITASEHLRGFSWRRWLPASGLTAATIAGFWIGMVLPASDIGLTYLSNVGLADTEIGAFVPAFGVEDFLEIDG